jgi:hypothetical protein
LTAKSHTQRERSSRSSKEIRTTWWCTSGRGSNLSRPSDKELEKLTFEDFETALAIVEYFMRKYTQVQQTASRLSRFSGAKSGGGSGLFNPEQLTRELVAETLKARQKPQQQEEETELPPEDVAAMKDVVNRVRGIKPESKTEGEQQSTTAS